VGLHGLSTRLQSWGCIDKSLASLDIVQTLLAPGGRLAYALARDGVCHVFESDSGRKLFEQRIIWAEPALGRSVEGAERFNKWRKECGLDFGGTNDAKAAGEKKCQQAGHCGKPPDQQMRQEIADKQSAQNC